MLIICRFHLFYLHNGYYHVLDTKVFPPPLFKIGVMSFLWFQICLQEVSWLSDFGGWKNKVHN